MTRPTWLAACSALAVAAASAQQATAAASGDHQARLALVREALLKAQPAIAATGEPLMVPAQWYNWNNWPNWGNWNNWQNWGNWPNWGNG